MKRPSTAEIEEQLARRSVGKMPDAEDFWSDFRARAKLVNQEKPAVPALVLLSPRGWAMAAACAALLAFAVGGFILFQGGADESGNHMTLDVVAAHSAVLIIEDELSQGTIVWVSDMQSEDNDGDSA